MVCPIEQKHSLPLTANLKHGTCSVCTQSCAVRKDDDRLVFVSLQKPFDDYAWCAGLLSMVDTLTRRRFCEVTVCKLAKFKFCKICMSDFCWLGQVGCGWKEIGVPNGISHLTNSLGFEIVG